MRVKNPPEKPTHKEFLLVQTEGQETEKDRKKRQALKEWVEVVNEAGEFGNWCNDISYNVKDVDGIIAKWMKN